MALMDRETKRTIRGLRRVSAGSRFDTSFVRRMISHHSGINTQTAEIADFRTWLSGRAR